MPPPPSPGEPSIYHALVVIFLEFFAWGLLTSPMITVLNQVIIFISSLLALPLTIIFSLFLTTLLQTFPDHTFLMNGLILGIKGILRYTINCRECSALLCSAVQCNTVQYSAIQYSAV